MQRVHCNLLDYNGKQTDSSGESSLQELLLEILIMIFVIGILLQWLAWKVRIPSIILLLLGGVLLGPILGAIPPEFHQGPVLPVLLKLALAIILFEGGLQLKFHELKEAGPIVKRVCSLGTLCHFALATAATHFILDFSLGISLVMGSILIVTGPTVILPLLRQSRIPRKLSSTLKWEGIVVDPFGALLTVLFYEFLISMEQGGNGLLTFVAAFGASIGIAAVTAGAATLLTLKLYRGGQLPEPLKVPMILTLLYAIYFIAEQVQHEAGLFAVTLFGILLGNRKISLLEELHKFKEPLTVILISLIFIILSSSLRFEDFDHIGFAPAVTYLAALLFIARPAGLLLSLIGTKLNWKERFFVSWIAPRGVVAAAVAGFIGPRLFEVGHQEAQALIPLIFLVIFTTVIVHGLSLGPLCRLLKLNDQSVDGLLVVGASPWGIDLAKTLGQLNYPVWVADQNYARLQNAKMAGLRTYYGEVLSDLGEESLDLTNIGTVLAVTENDSYNALVCKHFSSKVGRDNVFQLAMHNFEREERKMPQPFLRGNLILSSSEDFEALGKKHYLGWMFQRPKLTGEYSLEKLHEDLPEDAYILLLIRDQKKLFFNSPTKALRPKKGDVVVTYVPPSYLTRD